jgi:hypothetical protein
MISSPGMSGPVRSSVVNAGQTNDRRDPADTTHLGTSLF